MSEHQEKARESLRDARRRLFDWANSTDETPVGRDVLIVLEALTDAEKARFNNSQDACHYKTLYLREADRRDREADERGN